MNNKIAAKIRRELKKNINIDVKKSVKKFFKEKTRFYGVKISLIHKIAREYWREIKSYNKKTIFSICEKLLQSGYSEEAFVAYDFSFWISKDYQKQDFSVFEKWVNQYVSNWAECDSFCNHSVGAMIEKFPEYIERLRIWTKSDNRWVRRAAAVSLIVPGKKGMFLTDIFAISNSLLLDKDDLVQKGYGWLLKVASQVHQKNVFDYVMKNKKIMPRTALRYAIEKMPESLRKKAMS